MTIDGWIPDPNFLANENISEKQRNIEKERLTEDNVIIWRWNRNGNEGTKEISREKEICGATRR